MGASLRRGSVRLSRTAWYLVLRRILTSLRPIRPRRQLLNDDCLCVGHLRRNFGNIRFVIAQALCAWVPMVAALVLWGNPFDWIFAVLLTPLFLGIKFIAERLRTTLLDALFASRDMALLAKRFDTALNNMPHGLCMFDSKPSYRGRKPKAQSADGIAAGF